MRKIFNVYTGFITALVVVALLAFNGGKEKETSLGAFPIEGFNQGQIVKPTQLKEAYDFAGEPLPMQNFDVRERLEKELTINTFYHSGTSRNLRAMTRYFPVIEPILREYGLPDDLKYLAVAESNLSNVTSPAGAKGFWQFMRASAQQYRLEVNTEVDERFHVEKATHAACKYLKSLKDRFGTWSLAAAAYNMGPTKLSRELELQRMDSYYDMNLNQETSRYLFRIVALKEVLSHPEDFGYFFEEDDGYPPLANYRVVQVDQPILNLGDFAKEHGTTYRMVKLYNPWLIAHRLSNTARKTYEIKLPTS